MVGIPKELMPKTWKTVFTILDYDAHMMLEYCALCWSPNIIPPISLLKGVGLERQAR